MIRINASLAIRSGLLFGLAVLTPLAFAQGKVSADVDASAQRALQNRAPRFMENKGQWDNRARFYGAAPGLDYWITTDGVVLDTYRMQNRTSKEAEEHGETMYREGHVVRMQFVGGGSETLTGSSQHTEVTDFYLADAPQHARGVRSFGETLSRSIYPGVDFRNYYQNGYPRYDLIVHPGANANQIRIRFTGADGVKVANNGDLVVLTQVGEIRQAGLKAYQNINGVKTSVSARFKAISSEVVAIELGTFDRSRTLVIDPLVYGTHFGGDPLPMQPGFDEMRKVFSGPDGGVYLTGSTRCATFPINAGFYSNFNITGTSDAFLTRMGGDIFTIQYSVFIGGSGLERGYGIGMNKSGTSLWLAGTTTSANFPGVTGASFQPARAGATDAFLVNFSTDPLLFLVPQYATYYGIPGGAAVISVVDLAVGPTTGNVYFAGTAPSTGLPNMSNAYGGGASDSYLTIFNPTGTAINFSRYIGGSGGDPCNGFALDGQENSYVIGTCVFSGNQDTATAPVPRFVTTPGVFTNGRLLRNSDTFITKTDPAGVLMYAAVLGGTGHDGITAVPLFLDWPVPLAGFDLGDNIAVDDTGNIYVCTIASSFDYPRTAGVVGDQFSAAPVVAVTKINPNGSQIIYSTNINSTGNVQPRGLGVDKRGVCYIGGMVGFTIVAPMVPTIPGSIPTTPDAIDNQYTGGDRTFGATPGPGVWVSTTDGFVTALSPNASEFWYSSYVGQLGNDIVEAMFVDGSSSMYAPGTTAAVFDAVGAPQTPFGLPPGYLSNDAIKAQPDAAGDGFFFKMRIQLPTLQGITLNPSQIAGGLNAFSTATVTLVQAAPPGGVDVQVTIDNGAVASFVNGGSQTVTTVNIPAGQTAGTVQVFSLPVGTPQNTNVKAALDGDFKNAVLTVVPWLSQFTVQPASVVGGNPVQGRIVLAQPAGVGGVDVTLSTSTPNQVLLPNPPIINVPEGVQTLTFPLNTAGVAAPTAVDCTAALLGVLITANFNLTPAQLQSLTFNPSTISNGEKSVATVTLDGKTAGPTVVAIAYVSGLTGATFPATVTVPTQQSSVDFDVTVPFSALDTSLTLSATLNAIVKQGTLNVLSTDIVSVNLSSVNVLGGASLTGTVTISKPAGPGGFTVNLTTSDTNAMSFQTPNNNDTVTVQPGQVVSDTFTIQTNPVPVTVDVTITAKKTGFPGFSQATKILKIRALTMTFVIDPASVVGGVQPYPQGTITLSEAAPADITAQLTTDIGPALNLPADPVIPQGETTVVFDIPTLQVTTDYVGTVTADIGGNVIVSAPLTVRAPGIAGFEIIPPTIAGGLTALGVVTLDNPAPPGGVTVLIQSSSGAASVPASIDIPESATVGTFNIDTVPTPITTFATITVTRGVTSAQQVLTITPPNLGVLKLVPSTVRGGQTSVATLLLDANAPPGGLTVVVSASSPLLVNQPGTVFVPAGQNSVSWNIVANPVSRKIGVEIICTVPGRPTRASRYLFIRP